MSSECTGPLAGVKVLEFGSIITASWAEGLIADQGIAIARGAQLIEFADGWGQAEAIAAIEREDVPYHLHELPEHPHIAAMQVFAEVEHPQTVQIRQPLATAVFCGAPNGAPGCAPSLGEHNDQLLAALAESS